MRRKLPRDVAVLQIDGDERSLTGVDV